MTHPTRRAVSHIAYLSLLLSTLTGCDGEADTSDTPANAGGAGGQSDGGDDMGGEGTTEGGHDEDSGGRVHDGAGGMVEPAESKVASVYVDPQFEVQTLEGITYGQALSHADWGSDARETIDLTLDGYAPVRESDTPMPVIVLFHGGGFEFNDSTHAPIVRAARDFAAQGWMAFSVNYRLVEDCGTLPDDYPVIPELSPTHADRFRALYPAC